MKETVNHFLSNGSSVFAVLLDASKAFDRVHFPKLFQKLMERELPTPITRLLLNMYCGQKARIRWADVNSNYFPIKNGVRQGAVLSPILYCIYVDGLIKNLRTSGLGCTINGLYSGILCYADDITLLASSLMVMQKMLAICESYAKGHAIEFNATKSEAICFGTNADDYLNVALTLNGGPISWKTEIKHLGHILTQSMRNSVDVLEKKQSFINKVNAMLGRLHTVRPSILAKVYLTECCHFYGSNLWTTDDLRSITTAWKVAARRVLRLSPMTRSCYIHHLLETKPVTEKLQLNFIKFVESCIASDNMVVRQSGIRSLYSPFGFFKERLRNIFMTYRNYISLFSLCHLTRGILRMIKQDFENPAAEILIIKDLIAVRDGSLTIEEFDPEYVNYLLWYCSVT